MRSKIEAAPGRVIRARPMLIKNLVPERRVLWEFVEQFHGDQAVSVHDEWVGTRLIWKIEPYSHRGQLTSVHQGLVPHLDYVQSLKSYLKTGTGDPYHDSAKPNAKGERP